MPKEYTLVGNEMPIYVGNMKMRDMLSLDYSDLVFKFVKGNFFYIDAMYNYVVKCIKNDLNDAEKNNNLIAQNFAALYKDYIEKGNPDFLNEVKSDEKAEADGYIPTEIEVQDVQNLVFMARTTYVNAEIMADIDAVKEKNKGHKQAFSGFTGNNGELQEMIDLLSSGDRTFRGSSAEYKDIQNGLNDLKDFISDLKYEYSGTNKKIPWVENRYIATCISILKEKAENYLATHNSNKITGRYPVGSYESNRVLLMEKVFTRLSAREDIIKDKIYYFKDGNQPIDDKVKNRLKKLFKLNKENLGSGIFTRRAFAECIALDNVINSKTPCNVSDLKKLIEEGMNDSHYINAWTYGAGKKVSYNNIIKKCGIKLHDINDAKYSKDANDLTFEPDPSDSLKNIYVNLKQHKNSDNAPQV